jgi:hypothetical protein
MKRTLFTSFILLILLLVGCNPAGGTPTGTMDATPETTGGQTGSPSPEPTPVALPANLIAFYPLTSDFTDLTGNNSPATATIGSPSPDGLFCNAVCDVTTPYLSGLNFNAFTIRVEFLEPKYPLFQDTVFVGGEHRWAKFTLLPDGKVALGYNDDEITCSVQYQTNVWHEGVITYDGATLKLYLDGTEGCSVATPLTTGGVNLITLHDGGRDSSFIGIVKNLQVYNTVEVPQARIPQAGNVPLTDPTLTPADVILGSCPPEAELAAIDADLTLTFESDPSAGVLVCTAAEGSRDLTSFKRIVYTTLLVMKKIEFNQPLPWTDKQLYPWFVDTVDGIRFRGDIEYSSCCDPAGVINIQTGNLSVNDTNKWIDPQFNTGAMDLLMLFVHEARHNEFGGHTCGSNDNTRAEMGPWGVQYYLETYLANNLKDPSFLTIPDPSLAAYYSERASVNASQILFSSFCQDK